MKLLLSILFLSLPLCIFSQEESQDLTEYEKKLWLFEFNVELVNPVNAFARNKPDNTVGVSLSLLRERKIDGPLFWGGSFYLFSLGSENTTYVDTQSLEDISDRAVSLAMGFDLVFRYYLDYYIGNVEPFFEAVFGPRMFYSYTSTQSLTLGESIGFDVAEFDMSIAYGLGVGLHTTVYEQYGINTKAIFQPGFISEYLAKRNDDTIDSDNPLDYFRTVNSTSDIFRFQIGFVAIF